MYEQANRFGITNIPYLHIMDFNPELLHNQEKKEAHLRRAATFMRWLEEPRYANYVDAASSDELAKLISRLILWALEVSMPPENWRIFDSRFKELRDLIHTPPADGVSEAEHYAYCVSALRTTLASYSKRIEELYTQK